MNLKTILTHHQDLPDELLAKHLNIYEGLLGQGFFEALRNFSVNFQPHTNEENGDVFDNLDKIIDFFHPRSNSVLSFFTQFFDSDQASGIIRQTEIADILQRLQENRSESVHQVQQLVDWVVGWGAMLARSFQAETSAKRANVIIQQGILFFSQLKHLVHIFSLVGNVEESQKKLPEYYQLQTSLKELFFIYRYVFNQVFNQKLSIEEHQPDKYNFLNLFTRELKRSSRKGEFKYQKISNDFWEQLIHLIFTRTHVSRGFVLEMLVSDFHFAREIVMNHVKATKHLEDLLKSFPKHKALIVKALILDISPHLEEENLSRVENIQKIFSKKKSEDIYLVAWNLLLNEMDVVLSPKDVFQVIKQLPAEARKEYLLNCHTRIRDIFYEQIEQVPDHHDQRIIVPQAPNSSQTGPFQNLESPVIILYKYDRDVLETIRSLPIQFIKEEILRIQINHPRLAVHMKEKLKGDASYFYRICDITDLGHMHITLQINGKNRQFYEVFDRLTAHLPRDDRDQTGKQGVPIQETTRASRARRRSS